jgi:hypothetical protein
VVLVDQECFVLIFLRHVVERGFAHAHEGAELFF